MCGWFTRSIRKDGLRVLAASLMVAATTLSLADPVIDKLQDCGASSPQEARSLGDLLLDQGAYQHAGRCYEAAGDYDLANRAYLKAVEPTSKAAARELGRQRDQTKALYRNLQQAFRTDR